MGHITHASPPLVSWSDAHCTLFDKEPFVTKHRIHQLKRFQHDALIELIEKCPRDRLQVFTMGTDPLKRLEWTPVDTTGVSGTGIMQAVANGRLWVKLLRIDLFDECCRALVEQLYDEISKKFPGFRAYWLRPLLLISSPGAHVYYHVDGHPTMLWHIRGIKRVWVYPSKDPNFVDPERMENIFAGESDEEVPYRESYDEFANVYDLKPGELLVWPLNAPHRITNAESLNVSLSVPYGTALGERRSELYQANRYFRKRFGLPTRSTEDVGMAPFLKRFGFRAARRLGLTPVTSGRVYMTKLRVDPSSNGGVCPIPDGPVRTPY